jgi:hypothetical protein
MRAAGLIAAVGLTLGLAACGGAKRSASSNQPPLLPPDARAAERVDVAQFPSPRGRTLRQLTAGVEAGTQLAPATSVFTPGRNRLGFGLVDRSGKLVYGPSVVYVASGFDRPAQGPYPAPLDPMVTPPQFRSRTVSTDPASTKAIYAADVSLQKPGRYAVLALSRERGRLVGAAGQITVAARSLIPAPGQRPPRIHTPTATSARGLDKIDTRIPHDDMHRVDFAQVIGKRPVALLFATPALCQSRTCGPVTDIAVQLERQYGGRMTFIHNEVYVSNDPNKGYRPQLRAFHLQTEPWLFTFNRHGRVAARLEGAFGVNAFRRAIRAALTSG